MDKALRILKILTAISVLFVVIPGDKWDLPVLILSLLLVIVGQYSLIAIIFFGFQAYLIISSINKTEKKRQHFITIAIVILYNIVLATQIKKIFVSADSSIILPALLFITLSLSVLFLSVLKLKKLQNPEDGLHKNLKTKIPE
jgi:Na+/alanine symporter